jgi:hypothetical protein
MEAKRASAELEAFIDEGIKLSIEREYHPTIFVGCAMRAAPSMRLNDLSKARTFRQGSIGSTS